MPVALSTSLGEFALLLTPSKLKLTFMPSPRRTVEKVDQKNKERDDGETAVCTIGDASATYREMTDHGSNVFVKKASLHQKILLLALAQCIKRAGVPEVELENVRLSPSPLPRRSELTNSSLNRSSNGISTSSVKPPPRPSPRKRSSSPSSRGSTQCASSQPSRNEVITFNASEPSSPTTICSTC
jgi:hypothetical protein